MIFIGAGLASSGPALDDEITGARTITSFCSVSVVQGADGGSLLRAAKSKQCIGSYLLSAGGSSVACIDRLCTRDFGVTVRAWSVFNRTQDTDDLGPWNLQNYEASEGELVAFRYAEHCQGASAVPAGFRP